MRAAKEPYVSKISVDALAVDIWRLMHNDFENLYGPIGRTAAEKLSAGIPAYRAYEYPDYLGSSPARVKAWYQLESVFKKYRFQNDMYSPEQLEAKLYNEYRTYQVEKLSDFHVTHRARLVLQEARKVARSILGPFSIEAVKKACRFGRNSSVGCPFAFSYLDFKLLEGQALTGSVWARDWFFRDYLPGDHILSRVILPARESETILTRSLPFLAVEKSWKTYRGITPLPLLDLFITYGVGKVVEEKLDINAMISIKRGQEKHREWVKELSVTKSHATLDLSRASDGITSQLLNMVLPRDWYTFIKHLFFREVKFGDECCHTASVLPMGNGATFPLETLMFYCIIKAIANLTGTYGKIGVYGDDCIFPRRCYKYVCGIFTDLRIAVNADKTFNMRSFRESCGADYFAGTDVRPFFLPQGENFSRLKYRMYLNKVINGLRRRWEWCELPGTYEMLFRALRQASPDGVVLVVPPRFPDTSGVKVAEPRELITHGFCDSSPVRVTFRDGSVDYGFPFLAITPQGRPVSSTAPYFWDAMRAKSSNDDTNVFDRSPVSVMRALHALAAGDDPEVLTWRKQTFNLKVGSSNRVKKVEKYTFLCTDKQKFGYGTRAFGRGQKGNPVCSFWI